MSEVVGHKTLFVASLRKFYLRGRVPRIIDEAVYFGVFADYHGSSLAHRIEVSEVGGYDFYLRFGA